MKEESLLLLSDLQKLINQVVLIDYIIIILGGSDMRYFEFVHNLGLHAWDIAAFVALVILVIMIFVHHNVQNKRDYDFEKVLAD